MLCWEARGKIHGLVPSIRDWREARVEVATKCLDQTRQRVREILVFAATKSMSRHDDPAAEVTVVGIERDHLLALTTRQEFRHSRKPVLFEPSRHRLPIHPLGPARARQGC